MERKKTHKKKKKNDFVSEILVNRRVSDSELRDLGSNAGAQDCALEQDILASYSTCLYPRRVGSIQT